MPAPGTDTAGRRQEDAIVTGDARRLYDEMRALKGRAGERRRKRGQPSSQRAVEKALEKPPHSLESFRHRE
ncbi:hypothetical protein [Streptomyces sp. NPDC053367]|uniref:hypothetical protein n=1 Tax=Streptomyces sp. NPDC053367 TaxID=3365700 RepID=UPI0037D6B57C